MKEENSVRVRLRKQDRERLELIRDTLGISLSDTVRAALVALSRQMGFEKEFSPDLLKKR